jgi:hypothetical protein
LDELFTLLKLRESHRVAAAAGTVLLELSVTRLERIGEPDFRAAWEAVFNNTKGGALRIVPAEL